MLPRHKIFFSVVLSVFVLLSAVLIAQDQPSFRSKPGPHNTGYRAKIRLTKMGGMTITEPGTVLSQVHITGTIHVKADNVVIRRFRQQATSWYGIQCTYGAKNLQIIDGEIWGAKSAAIYGGNFHAKRLHIHDTGSDGIKATENAIVESCWIRNLGTQSGSHADGSQILRGSNFQFIGNFFQMPKGYGHSTNANLMIQSNSGPINNLVAEGNWFDGGNFILQVLEVNYPTTNIRITNNRFMETYTADGVRSYKYGTHRFNVPVEWHGNVWDATGVEIPLDD